MQLQTIFILLLGAMLFGLVWPGCRALLKQYWCVARFSATLKASNATEAAPPQSVVESQQMVIVVSYGAIGWLCTTYCKHVRIGFQFDAIRGIFTYKESDDGTPWIQPANAKSPYFSVNHWQIVFLVWHCLWYRNWAKMQRLRNSLYPLSSSYSRSWWCVTTRSDKVTEVDYAQWRQQAENVCRQKVQVIYLRRWSRACLRNYVSCCACFRLLYRNWADAPQQWVETQSSQVAPSAPAVDVMPSPFQRPTWQTPWY